MIGPLVTVTVAMLAVAAVSFWTARRASAGTLPRNDLVGIRTAATRASDAAWVAAHRAGAADLRGTGIAALATALLPWVATIVPAGAREPVLVVVIVSGIGAILGFSIHAAIVGERAARGATEPV
ncbi:SdpI family protein [Microbacterium sp. RURRCA19A]|uniref:SdpI family protein n=1 Tax=Microbacterium sp. RURRCA19A TaxID=1907391 RepID=UPI00095682C6|nr:SdpI family protein [Microbacterium sp. RURRCA19A]SIS07214.1 SdpI/YhfL protein family protein [Microbacterium sp. RURRCA19A]